MTATELVRLYRRKEASPVEAARAALDRIDRFNGAVNAYRHVDHDGALAAARESEARWRKDAPCGPLDGGPSSIKGLVLRASQAYAQAAPAEVPEAPRGSGT